MIVRATGLLLALIVLLVLIVFGALSSTAGNRLIVSLVEDMLDPALSVKGLSGSILSDLCAQEVRYEADGLKVRVEQVCINPRIWRSIDFLQLDLTSMRAVSVLIRTEPQSDSTPAASSGDPALPVDIVVDAVSLDRLKIDVVELSDLRAVLALSNADLSMAGRFAYDDIPVELATSGGWSDLELTVQALGAELDGEVDLLTEGLPWQARITSDKIDLSVFVERSLQLDSLSVEGSGDTASYRIDASGSVRDELGSGAFSLAAAGDSETLQLGRLDLTYLTLHDVPLRVDVLRSTGALSWADGFRFELDDIRLVGSLFDQALQVTADGLLLSEAAVSVRDAAATIDESARLALTGRMSFDGEIDLDVAAEQVPLALIDSRLAGLADLDAKIGGSLTAPGVRGEAAVRALAWEANAIGDLGASLQGSPGKGSARLTLSSAEGGAEISLQYEQTDSVYAIRLDEAVGRYSALGARATITEPVSIIAGENRLSMDRACVALSSDRLEAEAGRLCAELEYPDGGLTLELEPWALPRLPLPDSEVSVVGQMSLAVDLSGFAPIEGSAKVSLTGLVAQHPDLDPLRLGDLDATVSISRDQLKATLDTPSDRLQELLLNGEIESTLAAELPDSPIAGSVYMELDGIWAAQSLLPMEVAYELENVRGLMSVNAVVTGIVSDPVVDGSFKLEDAGWLVLALNADFSELQAQALLKGSELIEFKSSSMVGDGRMQLEGDIIGLNSETRRLRTSISLEAAELVDLPDYRAIVDGDLTLDMGAEDLTIKGAVHLPRASLVIAELPEGAVTASTDEVIVGEAQSAGVQQLRRTDVSLTLGDDVHLEAFGLTGRLSGNLRVREEPGRPRSVTGVISLNEAKFEAYGQQLTVERGRLTFSGPVDDPAVDVVATRIIDYDDREYRISLLITGTANDLQTEVHSQPSLSEDDALALLITGRTFSQITSNERSNVYGAGLSMGILNATGVTRNLADTLNLEEIIVDQDDAGNMEVGAAVRLNRNLYLRYTYGVFSRLGGVLLRYRFGNRFSVQAKTGDTQSIEIRYGVDD